LFFFLFFFCFFLFNILHLQQSETSQVSPSASPLEFRKNVWPRQTLVGQALEEDISEEVKN
jgi:hypothetical protein